MLALAGLSKSFGGVHAVDGLTLDLPRGAVFGLIGTHLPFFPVWLKAIGIDPSWIGIMTAVPSVTRFSILPAVTGLAERHGSGITVESELGRGSTFRFVMTDGGGHP